MRDKRGQSESHGDPHPSRTLEIPARRGLALMLPWMVRRESPATQPLHTIAQKSPDDVWPVRNAAVPAVRRRASSLPWPQQAGCPLTLTGWEACVPEPRPLIFERWYQKWSTAQTPADGWGSKLGIRCILRTKVEPTRNLLSLPGPGNGLCRSRTIPDGHIKLLVQPTGNECVIIILLKARSPIWTARKDSKKIEILVDRRVGFCENTSISNALGCGEPK